MRSAHRIFWKKGFRLYTPHPSNKLAKTTKEAGHADAGITDSNTMDLQVVQREHEDGASGGEKTTAEVLINNLGAGQRGRADAHRGAGSAIVAFRSGGVL